MRKVLESEARTVDEAVEIAVKRLGLPKEALQIEVLEEGYQTAQGSRSARVRVIHDPAAPVMATAAPPKPAPPAETPAQPAAPPVQVAAPPVLEEDADEAQDEELDEEQDDEEEREDEEDEEELDEEEDLQESDDGADEPEEVEELGEEELEERAPSRPTRARASRGDIAAEARALVSEILSLVGIPARVKSTRDGDKLRLFIESEMGGLLIGKNGKNIDALQHIVNRILSNGDRDRPIVVLDTEDYRRKRQESLEDLAFRAANRVRDTGRKVILQEMNPYDRRLIHIALKDDPDVMTESEGDGFLKRIMIFPSRKRRR